MISRFLACCLALVLYVATPALAEDLAAPTGEVLLTVTGNIRNTNAPGEAQFDLAMLERLPVRTITTQMPWYEDRKSFSGPLVSALLETVGGGGETLRVIALNDFWAEIPVSEMLEYPVILATRIDGATVSVREKGPTLVVYPFDDEPHLLDKLHLGRSVWQVTSIEIF